MPGSIPLLSAGRSPPGRQRVLSAPLQLQPQLGTVAPPSVGLIVGDLQQGLEAGRDGKRQRSIPLAAIAPPAIRTIVMVNHRPAQSAGQTAATELAVESQVAVLQPTDRGDVELVVPAVERVQRGQRRLQTSRSGPDSPTAN